jgi:hypothetical protein
MKKQDGRDGGDSPATAPLPANRRMTVIAQDPNVRRPDGSILMATIEVPAEDLVAGPIGYRAQLIDFDANSGQYHGAHLLPEAYEKEPRTWRAGDKSILDDYRFHAQNAYALVMKTLARFEFALGRRVGWSFGVHQLKVAPHGVMDANAFYSRREEGLVLGYFPGERGRNVYTCLSHDVVVHETTHALIDALRERYLDPSGPDQAAFHEGFADIVALLSVFAQPELVVELLRLPPTGTRPQGYLRDGDVTAEALRKTALFGLAEEMGKEVQMARGEALRRSAEILPDRKWLSDPEFAEPHRRGEILVAAVMNGFLEAWTMRLQAAKTPGQRLYAVARVAEEGSDIAAALVTMWIRGLDYMPPVHLEFGDALSAALTADLEVRPDDRRWRLREHMLASFQAYGIAPTSKRRDPKGVWERAPGDLQYDRVRFESMRSDRDEVFRFLWENRKRLEVRDGAYTEVLTVRPCTRVGPDGITLHETVAQYYQVARLTPRELRARKIDLPTQYVAALRREQREAERRRKARLKGAGAAQAEEGATGEDTEDPTTPVYGGGVLIFDEYGKLKYHVHNDVFGSRQTERLQYLWDVGQLQAGTRGAQLTAARLSALHRQRAIDARRFPEQGW